MLIEYNPDNYVTEIENHVCEFHKNNPHKSFAGCTCSSSFTQRKKTKEKQKNSYKLFGTNIDNAINTLRG